MTNDNVPLVAVASFATAFEAHLIKGLLEAEGLQVAIADEHLVSANSALAYAIGGVKLLVLAPHRERAMRILAAQRRGDYALAADDEPGECSVPEADTQVDTQAEPSRPPGRSPGGEQPP